jgi:diadenosine tetraphosphate (Ap4A) HIT family hydrolase
MQGCPFCEGGGRYFLEHGLAAAIWDAYPVSPGHALVVPRAHRRDIFECTPGELSDMAVLVCKVRDLLDAERSPDGYNVGTNAGAAAGQTVFHCHVHVIPRYKGDTHDPRGGVRRVRKPEVEY